jgi:rhamnose utilization protein RhaD (predicted bifunctional aldolase and dehydrogenase)
MSLTQPAPAVGHTLDPRPAPSAAPAALVGLSARLGADLLLVQGGGGNTSCKSNNDFWVKASGTWLAQAETQDIFVHLRLNDVRAAMASHAPESALLALVAADGPRASIETSLHALMPQSVVLHVHSVNTIAVAARADAQSLLNQQLQGLAWAWVPYRRPGLPLTDAIRETLAKAAATPDVLILGNHGLVVAGNDCTSAEALLHDVEARLALPARAPSPPDLNRLHAINDAGWRIADRDLIHALATDTVAREIAMHGALYPDHVVFLGERAFTLPDAASDPLAARSLRAALRDASARGLPEPGYVIVEDAGVLLSPSLSSGADAMLGCLAEVGLRLRHEDPLRYLGIDDVAALMGWEAEAYRRARDGAANRPDTTPMLNETPR